MSNHELLWFVVVLLVYIAVVLTIIMFNVATEP